MELTDYIRIIRANWRAILLFTLTGLLLAWLVTIFSPRVYAANATGVVQVAGESRTTAEQSIAYTMAKQRAVTYVDLAKAAPVADRVIKQLG